MKSGLDCCEIVKMPGALLVSYSDIIYSFSIKPGRLNLAKGFCQGMMI